MNIKQTKAMRHKTGYRRRIHRTKVIFLLIWRKFSSTYFPSRYTLVLPSDEGPLFLRNLTKAEVQWWKKWHSEQGEQLLQQKEVDETMVIERYRKTKLIYREVWKLQEVTDD